MKVLVCGSRTFDDYAKVESALNALCIDRIISGGASGADRMGELYAHDYGLPCDVYPAQWKQHGRSAGPIRNQQMLTEAKPDLVVAFVDKPLAESRGTAHMVGIARKAGVQTVVVVP